MDVLSNLQKKKKFIQQTDILNVERFQNEIN